MIRTLIVEDDYRIAGIHRTFTERIAGFEVVGEARSAAEALTLVEQLRPELVLLDVYLPDGSGLDVLRALHGPGRHPIDVIAITAAKDVDTLRAALQGGVIHYLVKPFQFNAFRERLESYAALRARLADLGEVGQGDVDQLYAMLRTRAAPLPKGFSATTLELVVRALREEGIDSSASEIARRTGMSRVTSRRYLDHLERTGVVELTMRYGAAGRPEHRYRWTVRTAPERPHE